MIYKILMIAVGVLLFGAGIADIRQKQVSRLFIIVLSGFCLAAAFAGRVTAVTDILNSAGGCLIGVCAVGISMVTGEQIGRGDGYVITAIGILLGFRGCLVAVCVASMIMCVAAVVLLLLKRGDRHTKMAFLPAIFVGYTVYAAALMG